MPRIVVALAAALLLASCAPGAAPPPPPVTAAPARDDAAADFILVQLNDVYEISPLEGGRVGGMARVATVVRRLERENANTIVVLAGDFVSPSLISSLGGGTGACRPIGGAQMVAAMNAVGVDYVTFGNHELDLSEPCLQARLDESDFTWISANVHRRGDGGPVPFVQAEAGPVRDFAVHGFRLRSGREVRLGLIGLTLPFNRAPYVTYEDVNAAATRALAAADGESDVVFALTHLTIEQDRALARALPALPLILGGHEHEHSEQMVGGTRIAKADANARTIYVHRVTVGADAARPRILTQLVPISDTIAEDPEVARLVAVWEGRADSLITAMGYDARDSIAVFTEPYDGHEAAIRNGPTNLGRLIALAMRAADPAAELAILNSGSIRLDDELLGTIHQRDVLRTLPFGGGIVHGTLPGSILARVLQAGLVTNRGEGGYLQLSSDVTGENGRWTIDGVPLDTGRSYEVVLPTFLSRGGEANLEFLNDPALYRPLELMGVAGAPRNDIRDVVIRYLKETGFPGPPRP